MPFCSAATSAFALISSSLSSLRGLLLGQLLQRLGDLHLARLAARAAHLLEHALDLAGQLFHAGRRHDLHLPAGMRRTSISISLVVEFASRSILRNFWRVGIGGLVGR
jgi:hypothetical protein